VYCPKDYTEVLLFVLTASKEAFMVGLSNSWGDATKGQMRAF
jgi:hypothetical protein